MIQFHSYFRWLILLLFVVTIAMHFVAMLKQKPFEKTHKNLSLFLVISLDIMLLIGIVVYFISPNGYDMVLAIGKDVLKVKDIRQIVLEHPLQMLIAIVLVHIGAAQRKKEIADTAKHKKMFWYYFIAFVLVLSGIPWRR